MRTAVLPLAALVALIATGCGSSVADDVDAAREAARSEHPILPVEQSCEQLAPSGGSDPLDEAAQVVLDTNGLRTYPEELWQRADEVRAVVDAVGYQAEPVLAEPLGKMYDVLNSIARAGEHGEPGDSVSVTGFAESRAQVIETCFPDKPTAMPGSAGSASATPSATAAVTPTGGSGNVPIPADTEVDAFCGPSDKEQLFFRESETTERVDTFGQVWERLNAGQLCDTDSGNSYDDEFKGVWAEREDDGSAHPSIVQDDDGNPVLAPEVAKLVEKVYGKEIPEEWGTAAELANRSVRGCIETSENVMSEKENPLAIRIFAVSLEMCPQHPQSGQRKELVKGLEAADAVYKQQQEDQKAAEQKRDEDIKNHRVATDGGRYLIGKTLEPGTYRTDQLQVEQCYWEIADAQGNIIDNNYINVAPQFEIYIPATASGFYIDGCSMTRIGD